MEHFHNKKLINPKYDDLKSFPSECFPFKKIFASLGLDGLVTNYGCYLPELVKFFHCSLTLKNNKLTSSVKGVPISLSVMQLRENLKIPYVNSEIRTNYDPNWHNYNMKLFVIVSTEFLRKNFVTKENA